MAAPLKQICDELGVCTEEALFYLEGFRWDLNAAMDACRSKTLPSLTAQPPSSSQPSSSSEYEISAAEDQMRDEKIASFLGISIESSAGDAIKYLNGSNWNLEEAAKSFYADLHDQPVVPVSHDGFSGSDLVQDVLSKVPQFRNAPTNLTIGSPPPSASTPRLELTQESIEQFQDLVSVASPPEVLHCLNYSKGNVTDAISYYYDVYSKKKKKPRPGIATAQVVKNTSGMAVDQDSSTESLQQHIPEDKPLVSSSHVEESGNPTQTLPLKGEESAEVQEEEHIGSFVKMTGETREDAIAYLEHFKWNVNEAVKFFEETGYSGEVLSALSMSLMENEDASSVPTETQRSLEKAGEGDGTVAIPGMAKANVKDRCV